MSMAFTLAGLEITIKNTRACINAILDGSINESEFQNMTIFNIQIPKTLKGVDTHVLTPRYTWSDPLEYDKAKRKLAEMYIENFNKIWEYPFNCVNSKI